MPAAETIKEGIILFLKGAHEIDCLLLDNYDIDTRALCHPVLVLHAVENTNDVVVCLVSDLC